MLLLALALAADAGARRAYAADDFDFTHVRLALEYFASPSDDMLERIAATDAASHLKRHADWSGYFPADSTARSISEALLSKAPSAATLAAVRDLVAFAAARPVQQRECRTTAAAYLPAGAMADAVLHVTWGYDIGVSTAGHASLNFAHPHFLADPQEIWFYCIHEMHHAGVLKLHPPAFVARIGSVRELYDFTRYATFLEGLAVHAARDARRIAGAEGADADYVLLNDADRLEHAVARYRDRLSFLRAEIGNELGDVHWQVVEEMSSGDRLWYVAGAAMADAIEKARGRAGLLQVTAAGPDDFFSAYEAIAALPAVQRTAAPENR